MEDIDAAGSLICQHNHPVGADGDVGRAKYHIAVVQQPKGRRECAVGVEDLDAVVAGVEHYDPPVGAKGDVGLSIELS